MIDLAIIGGGASGLMAACAAKRARPEAHVVLFERQPRVGKKLLITGNGRCNLSNRVIERAHYHGGGADEVPAVLVRFGISDAIAFFEGLGLLITEGEQCRLYPRSLQAGSVLDALRLCCDRLGVLTRTDSEITALHPDEPGFILTAGEEQIRARRVIVAAGGRAGPDVGGTDIGYALLSALGHSVTPLVPALAPIKTDPTHIKPLTGIKVEARLSLVRTASKAGMANLVAHADGEVLFTNTGISGPPAFALCRQLTDGDQLVIDLMPDYAPERLLHLLRERARRLPPAPTSAFLQGALNKRLGETVMKRALGVGSRTTDHLTDAELVAVRDTIKGFVLTNPMPASFRHAQVTAGGITAAEFDFTRMASRLHDGLFACGEVLDVDGDCGGYNLQWAWSSGVVAGMAAVE